MEKLFSFIEDRVVYPILIKNNGNSYLTLYYYTERADSILHREGKHLLYFQSIEEMRCFCTNNELTMENDIEEYDFDAPISNPIDYTIRFMIYYLGYVHLSSTFHIHTISEKRI